ncbi:hypothetical protein PV328_010099 [Microctonus aethiopoides]|uniref:Odorant receptor n=1 Tax=Microctonus aethiopoides TaxID=144406 RepID=A0AA39F008_9HYME|nr:hypothetical protein PV328_010099 [Microctonus aethiopoides]
MRNNSSKTTIPSFQYFFRVDVSILQWMGLSSFNSVFSSDEFNSSSWAACYFIVGVSMILSIVICQMCTICYVGVDLNYAIEIFSGLCTTLLCAIKGMRWWTHRHQLYYILRQLSMQWETTRVQNFFTIENLKAAENAKNMRGIYIISVCIVLFSYILRPYIMFLNYLSHRNTNDSFDYYHTTVYPAVYPFAIETLGRFCVVVTYQQIAACIVCVYWVSSDTLFAQIVLANRLENIIADDDNFKNDDVIRQQLDLKTKESELQNAFLKTRYDHFFTEIQPVKKRGKISLNSIESVDLFLTFSSMNYSQQLATLDWSEASKSVSHLITLSIQTVIYCGYADRLTRSSAQVCRAAYYSQWTEWSKGNKIMLMIIMMRAAKEYQCTSYGMIHLSLKQVTTIANGAVSYFMLLRRFG